MKIKTENKSKKWEYQGDKFGWEEVGFLQGVSTHILIRCIKGEIDLPLLAREALACRGLDLDQVWVGFQKAEQELLWDYKTNRQK